MIFYFLVLFARTLNCLRACYNFRFFKNFLVSCFEASSEQFIRLSLFVCFILLLFGRTRKRSCLFHIPLIFPILLSSFILGLEFSRESPVIIWQSEQTWKNQLFLSAIISRFYQSFYFPGKNPHNFMVLTMIFSTESFVVRFLIVSL